MKPTSVRHIISLLLLIVFMLPGIISVTAIVASHFDTSIISEVVLEIENEAENGKKGAEEKNVGFSEYYSNHSADYLLTPSIDYNRKSNIPADINYKESVYLSIPTPPPNYFMV